MSSQNKNQEGAIIGQQVSWDNRQIYTNHETLKGAVIVPALVPDSQIPLLLNTQALESILNRLDKLNTLHEDGKL